jgi:hypothetical protein
MIVVNKAEEAGRTVIKVNPSYTSQDSRRLAILLRLPLAFQPLRTFSL